MANKIVWAASPENDVVSYILERSTTSSGPWVPLASVLNDTAGSNYDVSSAAFFYVDTDGALTSWYHLIAVDNVGLRSQPSAPFQAQADTPPLVDVQTRIDHHFPTTDNLRYILASGEGVMNATVRVFKQEGFQPNSSIALALTTTDENGRWRDPIFVLPGYTYVVQFSKEGLYGPDHTTVVV